MSSTPQEPALGADVGGVDAENPWPGLASFTEGDSAFFHGRDTETDALLRLVRRERLSVLFGLSGLGKTSLVHAGLFPHLRDSDILPVSIRLDHADDAQPLAQQVFAAVRASAQAASVEAPAPDSATSLWEYFHLQQSEFWSARNRLVVPLLVFDQFEEIFTLGRGSPARMRRSDAFIREMADLAEGRPPASLQARLDADPEETGRYVFGRHAYRLLLTLREDFLADVEELRPMMPAVGQNRLRLTRLRGDEAVRVVTLGGGALVDDAVARQIVQFVAASAGGTTDAELARVEVEPSLLSLVCRELNNKRKSADPPRTKITADLLEGSRTEILREFYDRTMSEVPAAVRRFIEERLLSVSGHRNVAALEDATALADISIDGINLLVDRRLLRIDDRAGVPRIELTHDVLTSVIRESRDARRAIEAQAAEAAAAEAARVAAEHRAAMAQEEAARRFRQLRRSRVLGGLAFGLFAIAAAGSYLGWIGTRHARQAEARALQSERQARRGLIGAHLREASSLLATDRGQAALPYLARAIQLDPDDRRAGTMILDTLLRHPPRLPTAMWPSNVVFSADGLKGAIIGPNTVVTVVDTATRRTVSTFPHGEQVQHVTLSADGRLLATVTLEKNVVGVWNTESGSAVLGPTELGRRSTIVAIAISPDARWLVASQLLVGVLVWDLQHPSAEPALTLPSRLGLFKLEFSSSSRALVGSGSRGAVVWSPFPAAPPRELATPVALAHSTHMLAVTGPDGTVNFLNADDGKPIGRSLHHKDVVRIAFSDDDTLVATASSDHTIHVTRVITREPQCQPFHHDGTLYALFFSADSARIATVLSDGTAKMWSTRTCRQLGSPIEAGEGLSRATYATRVPTTLMASGTKMSGFYDDRVVRPRGLPVFLDGSARTAQFSDDGSTVLIGGSHAAQLWDVQSWKPIGAPISYVDSVGSEPKLNRTAKRVLARVDERTVQEVDAISGQSTGRNFQPRLINDFAFSPDGKHAIVAGLGGQLVDLETGHAVTFRSLMTRAVFSPDSRLLATTAVEATVLDVATGKQVGPPLKQGDSVINELAFSPDSSKLATADYAGNIGIWDLASNSTRVAEFKQQTSPEDIQFSPDGSKLVTTSGNNALLWDTSTARRLPVLFHHDADVRTVDFSPDGTRVVTASWDGTARVWDTATGTPMNLLAHDGPVVFARFSPDGRRVITGSVDGSARLWEVPTVVQSDVKLLAEIARAASGGTVTEEGNLEIRVGSDEALEALRRRLANNEWPASDAVSAVRWFLTDPWQRTISPYSSLNVDDFVARMIDTKHQGEADDAVPGHPRLAASAPQ